MSNPKTWNLTALEVVTNFCCLENQELLTSAVLITENTPATDIAHTNLH